MPKDTSKAKHFEPPASAGKSDIVLISSDGIRYNLHLKYLETASGLISNMVEDATPKAGEQIKLSDKSCERAAVMDLVAPYFYNVKPAKLDDEEVQELCDMMAMGNKWEIHRAHELAAVELAKRAYTPAEAFDVYCHAVKYDHPELQKAVENEAAIFQDFADDPHSFIPDLGAKGALDLHMVYTKGLRAEVEHLRWLKNGFELLHRVAKAYLKYPVKPLSNRDEDVRALAKDTRALKVALG